MNKSMYTVLDDRRQSQIVLNYIKNNPNPSIKKIVQNCMVTRRRLKYLENQGYFTLPKWTYNNELDKRFKNRQYISVTVGREYGKWNI